MKRIFASLIIATLPFTATAHSPVLTDGDVAMTRAEPYLIDEPEHSKAIFSELSGTSHYYRIDSDKPFNFYVGITAPKIEGCKLGKTFSFDVLDASFKPVDQRDGSKAPWGEWYEKFGKQWYWVGPEIGQEFKATTQYPAGTWYVRVYNTSNSGKYVLAIGDEERFGLGTLLTIRGTVKEINQKFWNPANCAS